jgi:hypothetical protein
VVALQVCDAVPARARSAAPVLSNPLLDAAKKSKRYCTEALKCLIERVHAYEQTSASRWVPLPPLLARDSRDILSGCIKLPFL